MKNTKRRITAFKSKVKHPLGVLMAALVIVFAGPSLGDPNQLPDLGEHATQYLSRADERALGKEFIRSIRSQAHIVQDPLVVEYIKLLGQRLVANSNKEDRDFEFFVVNRPSINAFAGPDGYIGIHTGLILATQTEGELASVLAHEIAHVTQNHIARAYAHNTQLTLPVLAGVLASIALSTQNSEAGAAALSSTLAGSAQSSVNEIRQNEKEADRIGIQILADSKINPRNMPAFFKRLQDAHRFSKRYIPEILLTHPVTVSRIADSENRSEQYEHIHDVPSEAFHIIKNRVKILTDKDPRKSINEFNAYPKGASIAQDNANRYALALSHFNNQSFDTAETMARSLFNANTNIPAYRVLLADSLREQGKLPEALTLLKDGVTHYPSSHALTMHYAKALLSANQAKEARALLLSHMYQHDQDLSVYTLLSEAQGAAGYVAEAHLTRAEKLLMLGRKQEAKTQLEYGLKTPDIKDHTKWQIEARLKELEEEK